VGPAPPPDGLRAPRVVAGQGPRSGVPSLTFFAQQRFGNHLRVEKRQGGLPREARHSLVLPAAREAQKAGVAGSVGGSEPSDTVMKPGKDTGNGLGLGYGHGP
jgi:hypothetical protein